MLGDLGSSSDVFGDRGVKIGVDGMLPSSDSLLGNSSPYLLAGLPIITFITVLVHIQKHNSFVWKTF